MSFMEGFASGFASSLENAEQRRATAKRDAFQVAYDTYTKRKEQYDKDEKANKILIDSAKQLTQTAGAPEGAWQHAYKLLQSGMSSENVLKTLQSSTFTMANPNASMTEDPAKIGTGIPSEDPTAKAGLTLGANTADKPATQDNSLLGTTFGENGIFNPQQMQKKQMEGANQAVMTATGMEQAQFDRVNNGFNPDIGQSPYTMQAVQGSGSDVPIVTKVSDAPIGLRADGTYIGRVLQKNGRWHTFDGKDVTDQVAGVVAADDYAAQRDAGKQVDALVAPISEKRVALSNFLSGINELGDLAQQHPQVLTYAGKASVLLSTADAEINGFFENFKTDQDTRKLITGVENSLTNSIMKNFQQNAGDSEAFAAAVVPLAYEMVKSNQSGPVTQADFESALKSILTSENADIFNNNLKKLATRQINAFNRTVDVAKSSNANLLAQGWNLNTSGLDQYKVDENTAKWLGDQSAPAQNATPDTPQATGVSEVTLTQQQLDALLATPGIKEQYPDLKVGQQVRVKQMPDGTIQIEVQGKDY